MLTRLTSLSDRSIWRFGRHFRCAALLPLAALCCLIFASGCARFRHQHHDMVYVSVRATYLHDRVAPVSNRVCEVVNGQPLEVLDHAKRFYKVKTGKNEIGWIEERAVIDAKTYDGFVQLGKQHKDDPGAATATLRDDLAMHLLPGRETPRFYLLAANDKVQLLERASAPKNPAAAFPIPIPKPAKPGQDGKPAQPDSTSNTAPNAAGAEEPAPPVIEDWWLARDQQGRVGWLLASRMDVDVPARCCAVCRGPAHCGRVGSGQGDRRSVGRAGPPGSRVSTVLDPPNRACLSISMRCASLHGASSIIAMRRRFRLHPIQGYLPVRVFTQNTPKGSVPAFSFQIAGSSDIRTDPATGITRPVTPRTIATK